MILDGHIHIHSGKPDPAGFAAQLGQAGVAGGVVISQPPATFLPGQDALAPRARLDNLFAWCASNAELYPFYWVDPIEEDAVEQVALAVEREVVGFKVICDRFYPGDPRALPVFQAIARAGKPLLFHSGILWDGKPSSVYNRPAGFEALLQVDGLRFSLAHISWPWCDELIAVYGKFLNAYTRRSDLAVEMFVDTTPGTPPIYRREALTKLFTVGYDVARNVFFGSDCTANDYHVDWVRQWVERDREIFRELELPSETVAGVLGENLRRFVGQSVEPVQKKKPRPAE